MNYIQAIDWNILAWIQRTLSNPLGDVLAPSITFLGNGGALWIFSAILLLMTKQYRKQGFLLLIGLLIGFITGNLLLKPLVARPRPCWLDPSVKLLIPNPRDFSFPSGHTLSSTIAATILTLSKNPLAPIAILLASAIAFSRLYLYVHFPSDILGAAFLGGLIGYGVLFFSGQFRRKAD